MSFHVLGDFKAIFRNSRFNLVVFIKARNGKKTDKAFDFLKCPRMTIKSAIIAQNIKAMRKNGFMIKFKMSFV